MSLSVMLHSRTQWPWECRKDPSSTFGEIVGEFAADKGWHPRVYTCHVGDVPVFQNTRLCDVTSGSSGCVLVFVSTPEDLCAHRVAEKLRLLATEQSHDLDQDGFYKFPVFFKA